MSSVDPVESFRQPLSIVAGSCFAALLCRLLIYVSFVPHHIIIGKLNSDKKAPFEDDNKKRAPICLIMPKSTVMTGAFCYCVEFYYSNVNCSSVNNIIIHFSDNILTE